MLCDPFVVATQGLITSLFAGPGTLPTQLAAASYTAVAAQFHAAAAGVDGSMVLMNESWRGPSSDKAQGAFHVYSTWLRQQGDVAAKTAAALITAADTYTAAQVEMGAVQAWLTEFEIRQSILAAGGPSTQPAMLLMETESIAIFGAAVAVMGGYEAGLSTALATFPEPVTAQPIVGNSGPEVPGGNPLEYSPSPGLSNASPTPAGSPSAGPSSTPAQQSPGAPAQPNNPVAQPGPSSTPADTAPATPDPVAQTPSTDQGPDNYDSGPDPANSVDDPGIDTATAGYTTGMTGFGGYAALSMARGGVGAISGSATGFRLPANWTARPGRAFGAADAEAEAQPVAGRGTAPKGATAPESQMRRRRDREKKATAAVIAPGEELEVPELEPGNVGVGVLEYVEEFAEEPIDEAAISLSVIERVDEAATLQSVTGDGRRD